MLQQWNIRSRSHHCAVTERPFEDGEKHYTAIYLDPKTSEYTRRDVSLDAWEQELSERTPFSFWKSVYEKSAPDGKPEITPKEDALTMLQRLIEEGNPHTENARYILAAMLERKRVLSPKDRKETEEGILLVYENKKTGEIYIVRDPELRLDEVAGVQEEVATLLGFGGPVVEAAKVAGVEIGPDGKIIRRKDKKKADEPKKEEAAAATATEVTTTETTTTTESSGATHQITESNESPATSESTETDESYQSQEATASEESTESEKAIEEDEDEDSDDEEDFDDEEIDEDKDLDEDEDEDFEDDAESDDDADNEDTSEDTPDETEESDSDEEEDDFDDEEDIDEEEDDEFDDEDEDADADADGEDTDEPAEEEGESVMEPEPEEDEDERR